MKMKKMSINFGKILRHKIFSLSFIRHEKLLFLK